MTAVRLANHLFRMGNTRDAEMSSDKTAQGIMADPQGHVDVLVKAGVLRYTGSSYYVVPPTCPTCGK